MALSAAARAALEQFRAQQTGQPADGKTQIEELGGSSDGGSGAAGAGHRTLQPPVPVASTPAEPLFTGGLFRPEQPKTFKESGISYRVIESLILKVIKQEGPQNEQQLSEMLKLSVNVFQEILKSLHKRELLDTPMPMTFDLTNKGREMVGIMEQDDGYVGPAPVSFQAYYDMCRSQAKRERRVTQDEVDEVFSNYPMRPEVRRMLREGFNSTSRIMLFYGPPGNGKSLITDNLHRLLKDPVLLPYAFEFNSKVVQLYDPAFHQLREDLMAQEEDELSDSLSTSGKPDRRWLISKAPLVTVGTEFKVAHFEIAFDGQYSAPPHVKANNGIFIFDDLGRQTEDHNMILNQFIYPLEQQESIVKFTGGSAMRVPFLERLFLSTNLNHEEILDDAFKRRLLYQVLVDRPTEELWRDIFHREGIKQGVEENLLLELTDAMVKWYKDDDRIIRAVDPRNLFRMIEATLYEGQRVSDVLDVKLFRRIYEQYPAALKKDAKFFVGALDSDAVERPTPRD